MSKKKLSLSDICKHILMVCGVITALTGTVGGVMDTFGGRGDKSESGNSGGESSGGDTIHNNTIIIEQRIVGGGGRAHISKSVDIDVGGEVGAANGDVPDGEAEADLPPTPEFEPVAMSSAPEVSLTDRVKNIWGWMLGIGFGVVMGIIGLGWWSKRKECNHESNGGR